MDGNFKKGFRFLETLHNFQKYNFCFKIFAFFCRKLLLLKQFKRKLWIDADVDQQIIKVKLLWERVKISGVVV